MAYGVSATATIRENETHLSNFGRAGLSSCGVSTRMSDGVARHEEIAPGGERLAGLLLSASVGQAPRSMAAKPGRTASNTKRPSRGLIVESDECLAGEPEGPIGQSGSTPKEASKGPLSETSRKSALHRIDQRLAAIWLCETSDAFDRLVSSGAVG